MVFGDSERLRRIKRRAPQDNEDHEGKVNDSIKKREKFCVKIRVSEMETLIQRSALSVQNEIIRVR